MLIPVIDDAALRQSEVVAYDPFVVSSRMVLGPSFLYGSFYQVGDEVFDGLNYHEVSAVISNDPEVKVGQSGTTTPDWATTLDGTTTSNQVVFKNLGKNSRAYGKTDELMMRLGHNSCSFIRVVFPDTTTPSVESVRLVLTAPIFQVNSSSGVFLSPTIVFEPITATSLTLSAESNVVASGNTAFPQGAIAKYAADVEIEANTDLTATGMVTFTRNSETFEVPEITPLSAIAYSSGSLTGQIIHLRQGEADLSADSSLDTMSFALGLVDSAYEPFDFENTPYPTSWPPYYLDTSSLITVGVPRFGEQVSLDLTGVIVPDRNVYTFVLFRAEDGVWGGPVTVGGEVVPLSLRTTTKTPSLLGNDQSSIAPYAQPVRNRRALTQALGGPYYGYVVDTYETETGKICPIPWFDSTEAKRIAKRMTETNFLASEPGLQVFVEYNASSQEFVVTQADFRIIEGVEQNGKKTEIRRYSPIRLADRLLYPIGTYDVPWLLVQKNYNPNPVILTSGPAFVRLESYSELFAV